MDIIWPCQIDFNESVSQTVNTTRFTGCRRLIFLYQFFFFLNLFLPFLFIQTQHGRRFASKRLLPSYTNISLPIAGNNFRTIPPVICVQYRRWIQL